MSEGTIFKIWHAAEDAPNVAHRSVTLGAPGLDEEARVRRAAELAANADGAASSHGWPALYRVLDTASGRLWSVRVDRITRPTYATISAEEEPPMSPAVHVLFRGEVACRDARLADVPSRWPEGQRWMSLTEFAAGSVPEPNAPRCAECWRRAAHWRRARDLAEGK